MFAICNKNTSTSLRTNCKVLIDNNDILQKTVCIAGEWRLLQIRAQSIRHRRHRFFGPAFAIGDKRAAGDDMALGGQHKRRSKRMDQEAKPGDPRQARTRILDGDNTTALITATTRPPVLREMSSGPREQRRSVGLVTGHSNWSVCLRFNSWRPDPSDSSEGTRQRTRNHHHRSKRIAMSCEKEQRHDDTCLRFPQGLCQYELRGCGDNTDRHQPHECLRAWPFPNQQRLHEGQRHERA